MVYTKNILVYWFILSFLFVLNKSSYSQYLNKTDSLEVKLLITDDDYTRFNIYEELIRENLYNDLNEAENYAIKALHLAEKENYKEDLAYSNVSLGIVYLSQKKYTKCLHYLLEGLKLAKILNADDMIAYAANNLIQVYNTLENPEEALKYAFIVLDILERNKIDYDDIKYIRRKVFVYGNIGNSYLQLNDLEKSKHYLNEGLLLAQKINQIDQIYKINIELGNIYLLEENYDKANQLFHKVYTNSDDHKIRKVIAASLLGKTYFILNNIDSAKIYLKKAIVLADESNNPQLVVDAHGQLSKIFFHENNSTQAYLELQIYKELSDSILNEKTLKEIANLENDLKWSEERKLIKEKQKLREYKFYGAGAIVILVLLLFILLFYSQRLKTRKNFLEKEGLENERKILQKDLLLANKELTSKIMYLLKRNNIIEDVSTKLLNLKYDLKKENVSKVMDIISDLQQTTDESVWKEFEYRFTNVYPAFSQNLSKKYPDLTQNEKKLCAFIKMDLTTKEIAYFTGSKPNAIDVAKTRLKKKFSIIEGNSLEEFLKSL